MVRILTTSESGHWYTALGEPCHEVQSADGKKMVKTTLAHARKLGLLPSVTSITNIKNKGSLNTWIKEQAILAALTATRREHESDADFVKRVAEDGDAQAKKAAEDGARIHGVIERYFDAGDSPADDDKVGQSAVAGVLRILEEFGLVADGCEIPFACVADGYAGCVDLHAHHKDTGRHAVLDFKTKDGLDRFKDKYGRPTMPSYYKDYGLQLAAYSHGSGNPDSMCISIPICRQTGDCLGIQWTQEEIDWCWRGFNLEKELWFWENKYDPRVKQ